MSASAIVTLTERHKASLRVMMGTSIVSLLYGVLLYTVPQASSAHGYEHLDLNHLPKIVASPDWPAGPYNNTACDWMHVNTVQALPENKWYDMGDERFKPGNVMISPRCLDTIYIIDRDTKEVVWSYSGDYRGGLSGQHEPHMIEKGLPGEGNILIFDNGASPWKDLAHCGCSYVLEINPVTKEIVWIYENDQLFYSRFTSNAQRLPNGNTLICEAAGKRIFEVTRRYLGIKKRVREEIVWEYVEGAGTNRAYRYPYDYCPQLRALRKPEEIPVTPPRDMRVPPDNPLMNAKILKESIKVLEEIIRMKCAKIEDLKKTVGLDKDLIIECLNLLTLYKLVIKDHNGSYKAAEEIATR